MPLTAASLQRRWTQLLSNSVDIIGIAYFRAVFGIIGLAWTTWVMTGRRFEYFYLDPVFRFKYFGFGWIDAFDKPIMYTLMYALGAAAALLALGLWYRIASIGFAVIFSYFFLLDRTNYQNHYYLLMLLSWMLVFIPANREFSLDVIRRPEIKSETAPGWCFYLLRFQVALPYIFGAIAKMESDWIRGMPMAIYLSKYIHSPVFGPLVTQHWCWVLFANGGLVFDLLVVPGLIHKRTRRYAVAAALIFHATNTFLFTIDVFPYFMALATPIFFEPDWLRKAFRRPDVRLPKPLKPTPALNGILAIYVALQLLIPLRQFLYPSNVGWHEFGQYFSWRMLARFKDGITFLYLNDATERKRTEVNQKKFLTERQIQRMARRPDLIWEFAQHIADETEHTGMRRRVEAASFLSYNGREHQFLIDPRIDLGSEPRSFLRPGWIVPIKHPFPDAEKIRKLQLWYEDIDEFGAKATAPLPWRGEARAH
jgi:hypothetical protein